MEIKQIILIVSYTLIVELLTILVYRIFARPKRKLIESSREKKKEEADINNRIFLHMTDGIIAFDMEGKIILINPAAKKLLSISPEDSSFEDVFGKFKLDINMEKIIYLENWTSTEERIEVEDRYVNAFFAPFEFSFTLDKDMNTRQGYLLFLAPKKSTTILTAKLLVALLQSVVIYTLILTVVPFCERLSERKFGAATTTFTELVQDMGFSVETSGVAGVIKTAVLLLLLWLFFACLGLFVSAIPGKGKLVNAIGVVGFFAAAFVVFYVLFQIENLFELINMPKTAGNIIEWAYMLGIEAALFFGAAKLMDKKVSL